MEVPWIWRFELVFTSYTVHVVVQVFFSLKIFPLSQIMVINLSQTKEVTLKLVNPLTPELPVTARTRLHCFKKLQLS